MPVDINDFTPRHNILQYDPSPNTFFSTSSVVYVQCSVRTDINDFRPPHSPPPVSGHSNNQHQSQGSVSPTSWVYVQWSVTDINDFTLRHNPNAQGGHLIPTHPSLWVYVQCSDTNINDFRLPHNPSNSQSHQRGTTPQAPIPQLVLWVFVQWSDKDIRNTGLGIRVVNIWRRRLNVSSKAALRKGGMMKGVYGIWDNMCRRNTPACGTVYFWPKMEKIFRARWANIYPNTIIEREMIQGIWLNDIDCQDIWLPHLLHHKPKSEFVSKCFKLRSLARPIYDVHV